ncbi:MAG: hypothetical protein UMU75_08660 [Halomonas sp.]|nr:hypothetical protein [Halomonas sp.]
MTTKTLPASAQDKPIHWPDEDARILPAHAYGGEIEPCACLLVETGMLDALARDFQAIFGK